MMRPIRLLPLLMLLGLVCLVACVRRAHQGPVDREAVGLLRMDARESADFTRLTFSWMGPVFFTHSLLPATADRPAEVTLLVRPATLPDTLPAPFTRVKGAHTFEATLGDGPASRVVVGPGEGDDEVAIRISGVQIARYRPALFSSPPRLVVDLFAEVETLPAGAEDDLGSLVSAMSDEPELPPAVGRPFLVVVDPGHGGPEPGAIGPNGVREKDINLLISKQIVRELGRVPGIEAVLTREVDMFLPLKARTDFANALDASLFVSIHCNASPNPAARGIETYYLNTATDEAAERLARQENGVLGGISADAGDADLASLLKDLSVDGLVSHSSALALEVQHSLIGSLRGTYDAETVRDLGVKTALFYVLVGSRMPSILVETSFVSNPVEEARLADRGFQSQVASAVVAGILTYAVEAHALSEDALNHLSKPEE